MALDFSKYVDIPVEDIDPPKPLPVGTYFATIAKTENREVDYKDGSGKTPVCTVHFRITSADTDVNPEDLPEGGGVGRIVTRDYRLNDPDSSGQYQLRRLGEDTCRLAVKGLFLRDVIRELVNQEVKVFNDPKTDDEGRSFPRIKRVLSIHEPLKEAA